MINASLYTFGGIISGRLVNRMGRKSLTVVPILIGGVAIIAYSRLPNVLLSGGILGISCLMVGMMDSASTNLIVEQMPDLVGVLVSLSRAVTQLGFSLGTSLGGVFLILYGYQDMFLILGSLAIISAFIFHIFTVDPLST
jgi:MFS family permease